MRDANLANRLGSPEAIALAAGREYRRGGFVRRHPALVFLLLPVVVLPVLWFASLWGMVFGSDLVGLQIFQASRAAIVLPAVVAAGLFYALSRRAMTHWRWPMFACGLLGILAGCAWIDFSLLPDGQHSLMFAFGISGRTLGLQSLQLAAPLGLCAVLLWRDGRLRGHRQICS